jgi:hypothetical protein
MEMILPRKPKRPALRVPSHRTDDFEAVAKLITRDPPKWLAMHLRDWAPSIFMAYGVDQRQPTRAEMKKILDSISNAAALLQRALAASSVSEFLDAGGQGPMEAVGTFRMMASEVHMRAGAAARLPNIINARGKARAGKGRALPDRAISAQTYCALLIAETSKWFRGEYPAARSMEAAQAIDLYWKLAGGQKDSWGKDTLTSWRYHLTKALKVEAKMERAEYHRHLTEAERSAAYFATNPA